MRIPPVLSATGSLLRRLAVLAICIAGTVTFADVVDAHYPVKAWLAWRLLAVWAYTITLNAACVMGGAAVLERLCGRPRMAPLEWLVQSMATGLVVFVLGFYLAGFSCQFKPWVAIAWPCLMLLAGFGSGRRMLRSFNAWRNKRQTQSLSGRAFTSVAALWGAGLIMFLAVRPIQLDPAVHQFDLLDPGLR